MLFPLHTGPVTAMSSPLLISRFNLFSTLSNCLLSRLDFFLYVNDSRVSIDETRENKDFRLSRGLALSEPSLKLIPFYRHSPQEILAFWKDKATLEFGAIGLISLTDPSRFRIQIPGDCFYSRCRTLLMRLRLERNSAKAINPSPK